MAIPIFVYWCIDKKAGTFILMGFSGAFLANQTLKNTFCVYRPWILDSRIVPYEKALTNATGYSFPSGHTTMAVSTYGSLAVWQRKRKPLMIICIILTLLTGFSRNWLGVHTGWDVLVALILPIAALFVAHIVLKLVERNPKCDLLVLIVGALLIGAALAFIILKPYPADLAADGTALVNIQEMQTDCFRSCGISFGFLLGWFLERRFVNYKIECSFAKRIIYFISGFGIALLLYVLVLPFAFSMLPENWNKLLKYFSVFLFVTFGFPAIMNYFEKRRQAKQN